MLIFHKEVTQLNQYLIDAITKSGLKFVRSHYIRKQFVLLEATHKVNNMAFGQYLILPLTYNQLMEISSDLNHYAAFEEEVLSPFYYRLKGDWGWNLYLCIVLEDRDLSEIPIEQLAKIERGKKYAKKIIIGFSEIHNRIPVAKIPARVTGSAAADPVGDWEQILNPAELFFCLSDYKSAMVDDYLENRFTQQERSTNRSEEAPAARQPNGSIQSLDFGHTYRSHLLSGAPTLDFAKVNLLHGPNGMGKTSVLECIELSFTGTIQRNVLSKANDPEYWDGSLTFANEEGMFIDTPDELVRKEREIAYYKNKVGRARSQMNRLFHQYNFFSSEAVHQFCYNIDERSNYRDDFSRVIFGEQLKRMEDSWIKYKDEFVKQNTRLRKQNKELTEKLEELQSQDVQQSQILKQRASSSVKNIKKWTGICKISYPMVDSNDDIKEIEAWLLHLSPLLKELNVISQPLFHEVVLSIDNEKSLIHELEGRSNALDNNRLRKDEVIQHLQGLQNSEELSEQVHSLRVQGTELLEAKSRFSTIGSTIRQHQHVFNQSHIRKRRRDIQQRKIDLISNIALITAYQEDYKHLRGESVTISSLHQAEIDIRQLLTSQDQAVKLFNKASDRVLQHEKQVGNLQRLASSLKAAGAEYLKGNREETQCPLCGHDHEDHETILTAIEKGLTMDDAEMTTLLQDKESKRVILINLESSIKELQRQTKIFQKLVEVYDSAILEQQFLGVTIVHPFTPASVFELFSQLDDRLLAMQQEYHNNENDIEELNENGFTLTIIEELELKINDQVLHSIIPDVMEITTSEELLSLIDMEIQRCADQWNQINTTIIRIEADTEFLIKEKIVKIKELDDLEMSISQDESSLMHFRNARNGLDILRGKNVYFGATDSWKTWKSYFEQLLMESESLRMILEPVVLYEQNNRIATQMENDIKRLDDQLKRGQQAVEILSALRPLASYSEDFVRANFEAISKLFVALHAPNEFSSLVLTDEGQIVAKRKGFSGESAIYQMSTGQRTAVTLAIFFVMHLVMDTAPKFLMLDEPVANMDELNVLGLLDFLRQLAITRNTQIFFTTANSQVAALFRRKFSFFKEDFRSYHFQRYLEGPVHIRLQQFKPQKEEAVVTIKL